jgi:hypothetical protein
MAGRSKVALTSAKPAKDKQPRGRPFKKGQPKIGGRKAGTPNRFSSDVREALLEAVNRLGSDGKGADGMVGYLMRYGDKRPTAVLSLLGRAMPGLVHTQSVVGRQFASYEDARAMLIEAGVPLDVLNHLRPYTTKQVEDHRRKAEEEAQRRREAAARGEPIAVDYEEIVE